MRVLVLYAHPVETSFGAAVHQTLVQTLRAGGHAVDDCDLNAEGFDPVMSRQDRIDYHDVASNRSRVAPYVERVLACEALVFSFPIWNQGFPAILKGFIDKVFLPGVSFVMKENGDYVPTLHNVKRLGAACTYGGDRLRTMLMGDPCRRVVKQLAARNLLAWCALRLCRPIRHEPYDRAKARRVPHTSGGDVRALVIFHAQFRRVNSSQLRIPTEGR